MSIPMNNYLESKKLGEEVGWNSDLIHAHANAKTIDDVSNLMRKLVDAFNASGSSDVVIEGMLDGINRSHRHLQYEFWNNFIVLMDKYSSQDEDRFFDGRNLVCRQMTQRMALASCDTKYTGG